MVSPGGVLRADDGVRTRDLHLGKVTRYQLRYVRIWAPRGAARGFDAPCVVITPLSTCPAL